MVKAIHAIVVEDGPSSIGQRRYDDSRALVPVQEAELRPVKALQVLIPRESMIAGSKIARFLKRLVEPEDSTHKIAIADGIHSLASEHGQTLYVWRASVMAPFPILCPSWNGLSFGPIGVREYQIVCSLPHPSDEVGLVSIGEIVVDEALGIFSHAWQAARSLSFDLHQTVGSCTTHGPSRASGQHGSLVLVVLQHVNSLIQHGMDLMQLVPV
mmetsp:Transcript_7872/g.17959  ORF Transcript_7872/g.17959 Transcript_7872/m.17959 type:complete len:213 (-) Transcript_7872:308-946(-)